MFQQALRNRLGRAAVAPLQGRHQRFGVGDYSPSRVRVSALSWPSASQPRAA